VPFQVFLLYIFQAFLCCVMTCWYLWTPQPFLFLFSLVCASSTISTSAFQPTYLYYGHYCDLQNYEPLSFKCYEAIINFLFATSNCCHPFLGDWMRNICSWLFEPWRLRSLLLMTVLSRWSRRRLHVCIRFQFSYVKVIWVL